MRRNGRLHSFAPSEPLETPVSSEVFKGEVQAWAERLDVTPAEVRLMGMSRRVGQLLHQRPGDLCHGLAWTARPRTT